MTGKEFIGRAQALLPSVRARARQAEQLRRLPEETFREFQEAGLFRALQPARFGGGELDPASFYEAVIEIGTACASSAWVLAVLGVHQWHIALFPPRAQEKVWGQDPSAESSSSYPPTGKVERVAGGFRLSGRWSFSSGCDCTGWALLGGVVRSQKEAGSLPEVLAFLVPRRDYRIEDTWHVAGLAGTGIKVDQIGISHCGIWVKGLDTVCAELKSKGVKLATPPHIGAKTEAGTFHTAFIEDPDGILIQLDELVPA